MQFLYPIGFIALASLILPILIHLWRVRKGKTLKIGSISLLGESAAASAKNLKLNQWLLLLLRCLFFASLAVLLAQPHLKGKPINTSQSGWILIERQQLHSTYLLHQKTIDSLLAKGFQLRDFGMGFTSLDLKDTVQEKGLQKPSSLINYTSLLKQANANLPNHYPVWIFADRAAAQFDEVLPTLHVDLTWRTLSLSRANQRYSSFLQKTYKANGTKKAVTYSLAKPEKLPALQVLVYPNSVADAQYVRAAITAIGNYLDRPVQFNDQSVNGQPLDVIFWLTTDDISAKVRQSLKPDGVLLSYVKGQPMQESSTLILGKNHAEERPSLKLRHSFNSDNLSEALWTDGFGHPILTVNKRDQTYSYQFYSQFNPAWTDLVWSAEFAEALMPILFKERPANFGFFPLKQIDNDQAIAAFEEAKQTKTLTNADQPLAKFYWVVAFILLLIERTLSFREKTKRD